MRAVPRLVCLSILSLGLVLGAISSVLTELTSAQSKQPLVLVATVDGPITPVVARYLDRAIRRAEDRSAQVLVIKLNTPGGLGSAMDDIVDDILESPVPVVVYVAPSNARAASAGVFITYAAHIAAMAPATNIGSASPIMTGTTGSLTSDETLKVKVMNDAIARITNLAELRGRNVEWAVSAVRDAANITSQQALDIGVIDLIEPNLESLLTTINGRQVMTTAGTFTLNTANANVDEINFSPIEEFLQLLANPTLAYLLVSFGMLGMYVELSHPGISVPGILGVVALLFGLVGLGSLPVAWAGLGLMGLAFVLFIIDLFVPSLGLLTIGGLVSFLIGSNILIADGGPDDLQVPQRIVWTMTACLGIAAALLGMLVLRNQFRPTHTGKAGMIGEVGMARTKLGPNGLVLVHGEVWNATAVGEPIEQGNHVAVESVTGLRITVRPATAAEIASVSEVGDRRAVISVR